MRLVGEEYRELHDVAHRHAAGLEHAAKILEAVPRLRRDVGGQRIGRGILAADSRRSEDRTDAASRGNRRAAVREAGHFDALLSHRESVKRAAARRKRHG